MAVISFARGIPSPDLLPVDVFGEAARAAVARDGRTILNYGPPDVRVKKQPGMVTKRSAEGVLNVCVPAPGPSKTRQLTFDVTPDTGFLTFPSQQYVLAPSPAKTTQLFKVGATPEPCGRKDKEPR